MTWTAFPITSAGRFSPLGPLGIVIQPFLSQWLTARQTTFTELNMGIFLTELRAEFLGHQIVASYPAFGDGKLYIDGAVVDETNGTTFPSRKVALLRGRLNDEKNKPHVVEVYMKGFLRFRLQICVDGKRIAGY
jgi:hypothetical protein